MHASHQSGPGSGGVRSTLEHLLAGCDTYRPEYMARVLKDASDACMECPSLKPSLEVFYSNTGESNTLLELKGTVPIFYHGTQYNIPMCFWVSKAYPDSAPIVYVTPTTGMEITPGHPNVSRDGQVSLPVLNEWHSSRTNLSKVISVCKDEFGKITPVHARGAPSSTPSISSPSSTPPPPPYSNFSASPYPRSNGLYPPSMPYPSSTPYPPPSPYSSSSTPYPRGNSNTPPPPPYPVSGLTGNHSSPSPISMRPSLASNVQNTGDEERVRLETRNQNALKSARQALEIKLQSEFNKFRERMKKELGEEMRTQNKLEEGQKTLEEGMHKLEEQKKTLEATIEELDMKETQLQTWLAEYGNNEDTDHASAMAQINLDEAIVPADGLSRQLFDCVAEINAIDDTLYHLDRALSNDIIDLTTFLKEVRKLARKQFMAKALAQKIQEHQQKMQMQTRQVPQLNSRPPAYRAH